MHLPSVLIGSAAILYGLYTAWARSAKPEQFKKLTAMKQAMGKAAGNAVHLIAYTIVPLVIGGVLIWKGLQGRPIF